MFFTIVHVHGIPRRRYGGIRRGICYGFRYDIMHDPIDIEDLNGKRRRGERIDKPSGFTYRPSDPNDPRERELQDND